MGEKKSWVDESLKAALGPYTVEQLGEAFDLVADKENWKLPVDAVIPAGSDMDLISRAVTWFTGSLAEWWYEPDGRIHVVVAGYYQSIGS